jgi:hypothetical protein
MMGDHDDRHAQRAIPNWTWTPVATERASAAPAPSSSRRHDLEIRSLLDDPALRRAMGLAPLVAIAATAPGSAAPRATVSAPATVPARSKPTRRFDRRRLLEAA